MSERSERTRGRSGLSPTGDRGLSWELELSHFPAPLTRWTADLCVRAQTEAIRRLAAEYGMLLDGIAMRELDGWVYSAVVPLGGKARTPPPTFLVPLLARVVPVLRTRIARARRTMAEDRFGAAVDEWLEGGEQAMLDEGRTLLDRDLDTGLAEAFDAAVDLSRRGVEQHFLLHGAGVNELGRLGLALTKAGWTAAEIAELYTGLSDASTGPAVAARAIAEDVRKADGEATLRAATTLDDVRAISPTVADGLDAYLHDWAVRAVRYEVADPTVAERPAWVLQALQRALDHVVDQGAAGAAAATRRGAAARAVETLGGGPDAERKVARAQRAFPIREGNETATIGVPLAALRRIGLAIGASLPLERPEDVFDLEPAEVRALLRDEPGAPADPAATARARREARLLAGRRTPPATIGPPAGPPPSLDGFPTDVAEVVEALLWYTDQIFGAKVEGDGDVVRGTGVAPGVYEGTARVVLDESGFDRIEPGDVLVCPITSPVWSMVFPSLGALVCDAGGPMSHPAIIARELGIPAVVGTGRA